MQDRLVSVDEAALICGVSDDTIRRRLARGSIPGAYRRGHGDRAPWAIPLSGLEAARLRPIVVDDRLPRAGRDLEQEVSALKTTLLAKDEVIAALELATDALREALRAKGDGRNPPSGHESDGG